MELDGETVCPSPSLLAHVETYAFFRHRVLAELLEEGTRSTLTIPSHRPSITPSTTSATSPSVAASQAPSANTLRGVNLLDMDAMRVFGINPSQALQHPGFYYYMAARCTEMRRERFLVAVETEARCLGQIVNPTAVC